jgi:exopolysaccharide biosynthesis protein
MTMALDMEAVDAKARRDRGELRRRVALLVFIALALPLGAVVKRTFFGRQPIEIENVTRYPLAEGVELVEATLVRGGDPGGRIIALYFDPSLVGLSLALNDAQDSLSEIAPDALAVMNAGFFTKERRPTGLLVSEGRILSPFVAHSGGAGSGVFLIENDTASLVERDQASALVSKRSFGPTAFAIQAGPRIIEPDGKDGIVKDDGAHANRTVIGENAEGEAIIAIVIGPAGWPSGPTLYEVQRLLGGTGLGRISRDLAFRFALNLDGGPSTGLHVRTKSHPIDAPENAPVHSVIVLRSKP